MAVADRYGIPHSKFLSWSKDDRDKAIAYHLHKAAACPGCGTREEEWEEDHNAYVGEVIRCRGCEVRARTESSISEDQGRGLHVVLRRGRGS